MSEKLKIFIEQNKYLVVSCVMVLLSAILLYILVSHTHCEHDDWYRRYPFFLGGRAQSIFDVFQAAWVHFHIDNARLVCAAWEFFFCSYLDSKTPYNIANSIVFVVFIAANIYLMSYRNSASLDRKQFVWWQTSLFVLLFYFLCPAPAETLCWMCGSIDYLWMTCASLLFLCIYLARKGSANNDRLLMGGVFALSVYLGISNNFAVVGIGGALFTYYLFHIREFRGVEVLMTVGFAIGALVVTFGPGNWARLGWQDEYQPIASFSSQFHNHGSLSLGTFTSSVKSLFVNYKSTWLMIASVIVLALKNYKGLISFFKRNQILFYAWFWSAFAFSFVLKADTRGLFFTETVALVVFIKIILEYFYSRKVLLGTVVVLCMAFCIDYPNAYSEIKKQYMYDREINQQMVDNNGEYCFDDIPSNHRFAMGVGYNYPYRYIGQEVKYGWKLVKHPRIFCEVIPEDKICTPVNQITNYVYRDGENIVVKIPSSECSGGQITCSIDYLVPQSFVRDWAAKLNFYKYRHNITLHFDKPTCYNEDYLWFFVKKWSSNGVEVIEINLSY